MIVFDRSSKKEKKTQYMGMHKDTVFFYRAKCYMSVMQTY